MNSETLGPTISNPDISAAVSPVSQGTIRLALFAAAYFFSHELAFLFPDSVKVLDVVWPAGGVGLAALLLSPRRQWPVVLAVLFATGSMADMMFGRPLAASFGFMAANVVETGASAWMIRRCCGDGVTFSRVVDVAALMAAATVVNAGSSVIGAGTAALISGKPFWNHYLTWWIADGLGILLVTPLLVTWARPLRQQSVRGWSRWVEGAALLCAWCAFAWFSFGPGNSLAAPLILKPYMCVPLVAWAALRFGPGYTASCLGILAVVAVGCTASGRSAFPLGGGSPIDRLLMVQVFLAFNWACAMLLAAGAAQRERAEALLGESERRFRDVSEAGGEFLWEIDVQGHLTYLSERVYQIMGYTPAEMLGRTPFEFMEAEEARRAQSFWHQAATVKDTVRGFEECLVAKSGQRIWVSLTAVPMKGSGGELIGFRGAAIEITDRKRAEAALRESEGRLRTFNEAAFDGIAISEHGLFVDVNARLAQLLGYEPAEMIGRPVTDFVAPEDRCLVRQNQASNLETAYESRLLRKDGTVIVTETRGRQCIHSGRPMRMTAVHDITARLQMEDRVRQLSKEQRAILDTAPIGIALTRGRAIQWTNSTYQSLLGYAPGEMRGMDTSVFYVNPEDYQRVGLESDARLRRGLTYRVEVELRSKKGAHFWCLLEGQAMDPRDLLVGVIWMVTDVTDRRNAMVKLARSESELAAIHDSSPLMMCLVNRLHHVERMNRTMSEFAAAELSSDSGQGPGDILGCLNALEHPQGCGSGKLCQVCPLRSAISKTFKTGEPCRQVETRLVLARNGPRREIELWATTSLVQVGETARVLVCLEDITQRKRLEAQFLQAQKMEAVGQLAGGVAHDFNNFLAAIMMQLGLLKHGLALDIETRDGLTELELAAKRAAALTRQLLMFSRRSVLEIKPLDVNEVVENLLKMLRRLIGEHIELKFQPASGLPQAEADAGMLEQVVMNLTVNARDAMPRGGQLLISTSQIQVDEEQTKQRADSRPGEFVCLTVQDTGCGMDEATLSRVFEPFFTTKEASRGTGLGLATVHGIVAQHKGWVEVKSVVGQGSSFRVFLPIASVGSRASAAQSSPEEIKGGSETILLVEDEPSLRRLASRSLRMLGYTVLEAGKGGEALSVWEQHHHNITLLFTDVVMPEGMNGLDLAERLKREKESLKVLVTSGYSADLTELHRNGCAGSTYLPKPYTTASLAKAARDCLDANGKAS